MKTLIKDLDIEAALVDDNATSCNLFLYYRRKLGNFHTSDHVRSAVCMRKLDYLEDDTSGRDLKGNLLSQAQEIYTTSTHPAKHIMYKDRLGPMYNFRNTVLEGEKSELDVKVADLAAIVRAREQEVADLDAVVTSVKVQNDNLSDQVHTPEDDRMREMNEKFDKLDIDLVELALHLEERFYPHLLTTISGRRWLLTHGLKLAIAKCLNSTEYLSSLGAAIGKAIEKGIQEGLSAGITYGVAGRVLTDVAAYNPSAEANYLSALQRLQSVNFSLITELKSSKNANTIMNLLRLEDSLAERLGLTESQPHVDQLMVPIHHSSDQRVIGASTLSLSLDVSSSRVQRIKENIANHRSALHDVFVPLSEPFSAIALMGTEVISAPIDTASTPSTTLASVSTITHISIEDYEVVGTDGQEAVNESVPNDATGGNVNPFPNVDDVELNVSQ
ncbi:hypothetical protein Tco_0615248 [Tanacetum coccineum]